NSQRLEKSAFISFLSRPCEHPVANDSMIERWTMVAGTDQVRSSQLLQYGCVGKSLQHLQSLQIFTGYTNSGIAHMQIQIRNTQQFLKRHHVKEEHADGEDESTLPTAFKLHPQIRLYRLHQKTTNPPSYKEIQDV
ncbi:hypothetical protein H5410_010269, partial [Solanum commersonii]